MKIQMTKISSEFQYAAQELQKFLGEFTNVSISSRGADAVIDFRINKTMEAHWYAISGTGDELVFSGGSVSAVLCGVYDALADAGILFEATGYSVPDHFDLDKFLHTNKMVKPKCRFRGIRQHINFTMDISSYTLSEALEYIRSLARMRFNAITFHTYAGQWHAECPQEEGSYAGHFFYGQDHPIPSDPLTASRIHNRKVYCIPEAEDIYFDEAARSDFAKKRLNEMMAAAKEASMAVTLSIEVHFDDDDKICAMLHEVCRTYPLIDTLELITDECGSKTTIPGLTRENAANILSGLFGKEILDENGNLPGLGDTLPEQLGPAVTCLRRIYRAVQLRDQWLAGLENIPALRVGMYLNCGHTIRILRPIYRKIFPESMTKSLLSAHGAQAVAENVGSIDMDEQDWQDYMLYSWAEFDGNMFLQQMSTEGLERLVQLSHADSIYGICINHWRTAENNPAISYAAENFIHPLTTIEFYVRYAKKMGIQDVGEFSAACRRLAALDTFCRDYLFNIGFCCVKCWFKENKTPRPRKHTIQAQDYGIWMYGEIADQFEKILPSAVSERGRKFLKLMVNRCRTSVLHIQSMRVLKDLNAYYDFDHPSEPSPEQAEKIQEILEKSRQYAWDYIHLYGEILPDRGGEGLLASYCETTPVFISAVAAEFSDCDEVKLPETFDAPPAPDEKSRI